MNPNSKSWPKIGKHQEDRAVSEKVARVRGLKDQGAKIACLTAYDYPSARLIDEAGIDVILVGDSLGMVVLGYEDTTRVTMPEMEHHTRAVARAVSKALVIGDLPYCSYETPGQALENARRLIDAGADAVKLEGGIDQIPQVERIRNHGIVVVGHVGMLPQQVRVEGGYKKKGKTDQGAQKILDDCLALQKAGACMIVLESMVNSVAKEITENLEIPTIGIGAGVGCDGQILVTHDLLGAFPWFRPSFARPRANLAGETTKAVEAYIEAIRSGKDGKME